MTGPLRLLLTSDAVGGVWTYSLDLAGALASKGVEVVLATLGPSPTPERRSAAEALGIRLIDTGLPLDWTAQSPEEITEACASLARLASGEGADLVQLHSPALAAGADWPVPLLSVVHSCVASWWAAVKQGDLPEDFAWRTRLARDGMLRSDLLVAPSHALAGEIGRLYRIPSPAVVHNGRAPLATCAAAPADHLLTTGRLWDEGKNVAALDRAAALLDAPLLAAGPLAGPNGAAIGLGHAHWLGELTTAGLAAELSRRPLFVSAALYEPFGLAVLEAAQAGCALLLSDIPTFRELWDGAAAFFPPHDQPAIAEAAERLLADRAERERLGEAARERSERFSVEAMAGAMLGHYRALLAAEKRRAA